jgi:hypothetical protein
MVLSEESPISMNVHPLDYLGLSAVTRSTQPTIELSPQSRVKLLKASHRRANESLTFQDQDSLVEGTGLAASNTRLLGRLYSTT